MAVVIEHSEKNRILSLYGLIQENTNQPIGVRDGYLIFNNKNYEFYRNGTKLTVYNLQKLPNGDYNITAGKLGIKRTKPLGKELIDDIIKQINSKGFAKGVVKGDDNQQISFEVKPA